jgi:hypothetical protein
MTTGSAGFTRPGSWCLATPGAPQSGGSWCPATPTSPGSGSYCTANQDPDVGLQQGLKNQVATAHLARLRLPQRDQDQVATTGPNPSAQLHQGHQNQIATTPGTGIHHHQQDQITI